MSGPPPAGACSRPDYSQHCSQPAAFPKQLHFWTAACYVCTLTFYRWWQPQAACCMRCACMSHLLHCDGCSLAFQNVAAGAAVLCPVLPLICAAGGPVIRQCWEAGCLQRSGRKGSARWQITEAIPVAGRLGPDPANRQAVHRQVHGRHLVQVRQLSKICHLEAALTAAESSFPSWASCNARAFKIAGCLHVLQGGCVELQGGEASQASKALQAAQGWSASACSAAGSRTTSNIRDAPSAGHMQAACHQADRLLR